MSNFVAFATDFVAFAIDYVESSVPVSAEGDASKFFYDCNGLF
jgi:hypothetical protein